ncbi:conserved hypothetical protein [Ricinus communis]|uniref:Uncharacterized protein n=1 Tax=Ricinus communis TaxID=3988 RepID=B9S409_RICCO|nr:conserved hypothetical protein [Ricinus communis]
MDWNGGFEREMVYGFGDFVTRVCLHGACVVRGAGWPTCLCITSCGSNIPRFTYV